MSTFLIKNARIAKTKPFNKIIEVFNFGAQVIAAANATKKGDQQASLANARVKRTTCKFVKGAFLYILSATKIKEERFITEPKR